MRTHVMAGVLALFASASAEAGTPQFHLLWAGELSDSAGPVNRVVTATFVVKDGTSTVSQVEEASFDVLDGALIVDLLVTDAEDLTLDVIINGEALGTAPLRSTWPSAQFVEFAAVADVADTATAVGAVTSPLTKTALNTPGSVTIPFANVAGFPDAFLDGDQGVDFVPEAENFTFENGIISIKPASITTGQITSVLAQDIALNAITSAKIDDGTVRDANLPPSIPLSKIAPDAVTATKFGNITTRTKLFRVPVNGCELPLHALTTRPTCSFLGTVECQFVNEDDVLEQRVLDCTGACVDSLGFASICQNEQIGSAVFK